ncbi:MAG: PDZ domain-containing protein [Chloroflexaceae bacterium]|nr:PDZ domain-containing protein [Chloroflexaceae bacterium]
MSIFWRNLGIYLGLLAVGAGIGIGSRRYFPQSPQEESQPVTVQPSTFPFSLTPQASDNLNFIAQAVQRVGPAVVRIDASRRVSSSVPEPFRRFFNDEAAPFPADRVEQGTGSGFILTADGRLITNAHVVEGADLVKVTLKDGQVFDGKVVGSDPVTDVAAVQISARNLPTVTLGTTRSLIPGEWAIAIGNPLGLDNTVTVGIISALDRSSSQVGVPDKRVRFIQTDAAINPGNSGGPLLNAQGEVIGINTAIRADAEGLGFAIPIETAQRIADQLFANGKAEHPYLGIHMITLTEAVRVEMNESGEFPFKIMGDRGVVVVRVVENSPAAAAGFQGGDIIEKVGGKSVETAVDVQERVETSRIGEELPVEVLRGEKREVLAVRPGVFPEE